MIPRNSREKDCSSECNTLQMANERMCKKTFKSNKYKLDICTDIQKFKSPIFNIHIHVPSYDEGNPSPIILPKIKPVIHLHFNGFSKKLEIDSKRKSEGSVHRGLEKFMKMALPKFGDVKLHFKRQSRDRNMKDSNCHVTQCTSQGCFKDTRINKGYEMQMSHYKRRLASKNLYISKSTSYFSSSSFNSEEKNNGKMSISCSQYKDLKLKEAVVMLIDICKTKTYKEIVASAVKSPLEPENYERNSLQENYKLVNEVQNRYESKKEQGLCSVKEQNCSKSVFSNICQDKMYVSDYVSTFRLGVDNRTINKETDREEKSLTALAEGCNFSDIIRRFHLKSSHYVAESSKNSHNDDEGDTLSIMGSENCRDSMKQKIKNENYDNESSSETSENETDLDEKIYSKGSDIVGGTSSPSLLYCYDETDNTAIGTVRDGFFSETTKQKTKETTPTNSEFESSTSYISDLESDVDKMTSREFSVLENIEDMENINCSPYKMPLSVQANNNEVLKTNVKSVSRISNPNFHFPLIKKNMKRKNYPKSSINKKSTNSDIQGKYKPGLSEPSNAVSPKKKKPTKKKGKKSGKKTVVLSTEEYIPLSAPGPTKFAIAPLNKVKPYKTHNAKNFKEEMLFGNRVNRFSSSDHLRIYKLKQAARQSVN